MFRNKLDEQGQIVRNKARLVIQAYNQEEEINYDKTFASVARIEAIRILVAYAAHMEFKLYQIDVKSVFLNGYLQEEVYVKKKPQVLRIPCILIMYINWTKHSMI